MKLVLIDNYDSFTYNLKALFVDRGVKVDVIRNDKLIVTDLHHYDGIILSPGPGVPKSAGLLLEIIEYYKSGKPMIGICLGMQAIGEVFGAKLQVMSKPLHGISLPVFHQGDSIFKGLENNFEAARYHSWAISAEDFPSTLEIIAKSKNETIMAVKHKDRPIYGFQFHPESILTEGGERLVENFIEQIKIYKHESINT